MQALSDGAGSTPARPLTEPDRETSPSHTHQTISANRTVLDQTLEFFSYWPRL